MSKKWYVLHTYSGYENKVKAALETRIETMGLENNIFGIEIPTQVVAEIKDGGKRVESEKKVFPGYVLVRMELDDRSWAAVRSTPGVTGFVGSQGNPAPLTREEYNKIMKRTSKETPGKFPRIWKPVWLSRFLLVLWRTSMALFPRFSPKPVKSKSLFPSLDAKPPLNLLLIRFQRFKTITRASFCARVDRGFSQRMFS